MPSPYVNDAFANLTSRAPKGKGKRGAAGYQRDADDAWNNMHHYLRVAGVSPEAQSAIETWVRAYGVAMKAQGKAEA